MPVRQKQSMEVNTGGECPQASQMKGLLHSLWHLLWRVSVFPAPHLHLARLLSVFDRQSSLPVVERYAGGLVTETLSNSRRGRRLGEGRGGEKGGDANDYVSMIFAHPHALTSLTQTRMLLEKLLEGCRLSGQASKLSWGGRRQVKKRREKRMH